MDGSSGHRKLQGVGGSQAWALGRRGTDGARSGRDVSLEAGEASARQRGGVRAFQVGNSRDKRQW